MNGSSGRDGADHVRCVASPSSRLGPLSSKVNDFNQFLITDHTRHWPMGDTHCRVRDHAKHFHPLGWVWWGHFDSTWIKKSRQCWPRLPHVLLLTGPSVCWPLVLTWPGASPQHRPGLGGLFHHVGLIGTRSFVQHDEMMLLRCRTKQWPASPNSRNLKEGRVRSFWITYWPWYWHNSSGLCCHH